MTTKEKQEHEGAGPHMDEVSEETRTFAAWWIHRLKYTVKSHELTWHVPGFHLENCMGEVVFEWDAYPTRKKLSVFVEGESVTYLRHWDWDDKGKSGSMEEGECSWLDHGLLLWHWLFSSSSL